MQVTLMVYAFQISPDPGAGYKYQLVYPLSFKLGDKTGCIRTIDCNWNCGNYMVMMHLEIKVWVESDNIVYSARVLWIDHIRQ